MTTVSSSSIAAILVAFAAYLLFMIVIGAICMRRTNSSEDYFLGGRGLNAWVAALSAQASDMSGWLLMGLPGSIYALGTGQAWIAIGLFLGTVCNWLLISKRLRRYTIVAGNSMTLPEFLENRFHDKKKVLLSISSVVIIIFFLVYLWHKQKGNKINTIIKSLIYEKYKQEKYTIICNVLLIDHSLCQCANQR